jgi:hypothetical protein
VRKKRRPNILLIGVDSLRADHISRYGYPLERRQPPPVTAKSASRCARPPTRTPREGRRITPGG